MPPAWRSFLLALLALLPVAMLVFLWDCSFFVAWNGQAVSVAPTRSEAPASYVVRIREGEGRDVRTVNWDAAVVQQLSLPVDSVEMAPILLPETAPETEKGRFSLSYRVQLGQGTEQARWIDVPTTSPRSVGIAALVFLLLVAVRNMVVSGSPVALVPVKAKNSTAAPPNSSGNPSPPPKAGGSRKGPPPGKRRKGRGRR